MQTSFLIMKNDNISLLSLSAASIWYVRFHDKLSKKWVTHPDKFEFALVHFLKPVFFYFVYDHQKSYENLFGDIYVYLSSQGIYPSRYSNEGRHTLLLTN